MNNRSRMFSLLFILSIFISSLPANSKEYMFRLKVTNPWYSGVVARFWLYSHKHKTTKTLLIGQSKTFHITDPYAQFDIGTYWYCATSGYRCWGMQPLKGKTSGSISVWGGEASQMTHHGVKVLLYYWTRHGEDC